MVQRSFVCPAKPSARRGLAIAAATLASVAFGATGPVAPASAEQTLEVFDLPSVHGRVDLTQNRLNATTKLRATVLLPDGYAEQPDRRWPVLYLLHGAQDNTGTWSNPKSGFVRRGAAGLPAIVVMPEGGRSYYADHWRGGQRADSNWERYFLEDVIPTIESRYRLLPGRSNHAIMGSSMGGLGAVLYAAEFPSYFGSTVSMSGLLDLEEPGAMFLVPNGNNVKFGRIWGPYGGAYAQGHSPLRLLGNLLHTRVRLSTGNGQVDQRVPANANQALIGGAIEVLTEKNTRDAYTRAKARGVDVTFAKHKGVHDWPYWRDDLPRALEWQPFKPNPASDASAAEHFTYRTIAPRGNAWGLGYRFAALPNRIMDLTRDGQTVSAIGAGTVTITPGAAEADASGAGTRSDCAFTAALPFTRRLPAGC